MKISKRESQRLERRAQIIAVARKLFFEHGFDGTSMSGIAASLGGSKGTLWSYFASKEELFAAVVEDTAAGIRGGIDVSGEGESPLEVLTSLCRSVIDRTTSPIVLQMFRLVGAVADRRPDLAQVFFARGPLRTMAMIGDYLRENFAEHLRITDYEEAGRDLVVMASAYLHFLTMWGFQVSPTVKEKDARARHAAEVFIRAYARDPEALLALS